MSTPAQRVLLIGWDAADWNLINPLLEQGLMPALDGMVNHGVMGNLATLRPVLSPMLWNSIATGKRANKHGILGFMEPDPHQGGVRPVSSTSRKVKAVWNILTQKGYRTHVVGWFAGHPAEPIRGISVSDLYPYATTPLGEEWPLAPGSVHPAGMEQTFAALRMHPAEVTEAAILPWIPRAAEIDQEKDRKLATFAKILAENCSIHNAATWILRNQPWDFLAVYYNGLDHFCHGFMHYHPPRMPGVPEEQFEIYKGVVTGAYRFHDMMLETLLSLAGPETTVILVSDHGFHSDHLRPTAIPREPAGPAVQHRAFGVFCMKGPKVRQDERIYGATLLDIAPTILTLFGLPVGHDMDGRALVQAFEQPPELKRIPSWEDEPGECGMHAEGMRIDAASAQIALQQFVALGYINPPSNDQKQAAAMALREQNYNLARDFLDAGQPADALPLLEQLAGEAPRQWRFQLQLAQCYIALRRREEAKRILKALLAGPKQDAERSQAEDEPEPAEPRRRQWADLLMGIIQLEEGKSGQALDSLLRAEASNPDLPHLHLRIGQTYMRLQKLEDAERSFQRALEIDPESPEVHVCLARVRLRQGRNAEAIDEALQGVGLQHFLPLGHFYLGVALARLGQVQRAMLAFETSVSMQPGLLAAHRWLAALYSRPEGDSAKAEQHRSLYRQLRGRAARKLA